MKCSCGVLDAMVDIYVELMEARSDLSGMSFRMTLVSLPISVKVWVAVM